MGMFTDISDWRSEHEEFCQAADGIAVAAVAGLSIYSLTTAKRADNKATQALTEVRGVEASLARNNAGYTGYGAAENQAFLAQFQKR